MDGEKRKLFWEKLLSLCGSDPELKDLNDFIEYPNRIFRYRKMSVETLSALAENRMFFSSPQYFDDPFDTYTCIKRDIDLNSIFPSWSNELIEENKKLFNEYFVSSQEKTSFYKDIQLACFTEKHDNEVLWLKYTDNHNGIALEYGIHNKTPFTKMFYPVFYADEKYQHNTLEYDDLKGSMSLVKKNSPEARSARQYFEKMSNIERIRISLVKNNCHEYDEEWRAFYFGTKRRHIQCPPSCIYLGLRMKDHEKRLVKKIAFMAGIKKIKQMIIDENGIFKSIDVSQ